MKKIFALILATTFIFALSACGQQSNDAPNPNPNGTIERTGEPEEYPPVNIVPGVELDEPDELPDTEQPNLSEIAIENTNLSPEEAAKELAILFMDNLKAEKEERTFRVTEYKDLSVSVMPTSQMDKETAAIYFLKDEEISPDTWIVEISVSYKYEGTLSPIGPSNGEWIDVLYQASPVGFLMTKEGNSYSLQSRYE